MSIATQINRIRAQRELIKAAIADKGVEVPSDAVLADLPALVAEIPQGGADGKLYVVGQNSLTAYIRYFNESANRINVHNHDITFTKSSDSNGGAGFSTFDKIDVTGYNKLIVTATSSSVRNTDVERYLPRFGLSSAYAQNLEVSYSAVARMCEAGTTSFSERTVELDISGITGNYYLTYTGVASMVITDFHLE